LFEFIRSKTAQYYGNPYLFSPPRVQLFSVLLNVLVFRFLLITYDREKTAKGILFITVIAAFTYLFYFYRFQQQS
ncbi:MAG TPA: hypothetical protein PLU53_13515, partial [Bacteroidia bacterium]|nr:hypothetical protein [Bacteroidia bacterium]